MLPAVSQRYVIGLGANLGDRLGALRAAVSALRQRGAVQRVSGLYETPAIGPPQPDFLNGAVLLQTELRPLALLNELLEIEARLGRLRREKWGPRTLDLDVLLCPGVVIAENRLEVPHPELTRRNFALRPLLDVLPDARDPRSSVPYREHLEAIGPAPLVVHFATGEWASVEASGASPGRAE